MLTIAAIIVFRLEFICPIKTLNLGPQHPAVHGVLRIICSMGGETITEARADIGYLHRGTEKLSEYLQGNQIEGLFDRFDYVSTASYEALFSMRDIAAKNIKQCVHTVVISELARIVNHLLCITTALMDLGAVTPFLWAFEIREGLLEVFEEATGSRLHSQIISSLGFHINYNKVFR